MRPSNRQGEVADCSWGSDPPLAVTRLRPEQNSKEGSANKDETPEKQAQKVFKIILDNISIFMVQSVKRQKEVERKNVELDEWRLSLKQRKLDEGKSGSSTRNQSRNARKIWKK